MKFKVLKNFTHEGKLFAANEIFNVSELYSGADKSLVKHGFIEIIKKKGKKDVNNRNS